MGAKMGNPKSISNSVKYNSCPSGLVSNVDQHGRKASRNAFPLFDVKEEDLCFPKKGVLEPTFPEDADLG